MKKILILAIGSLMIFSSKCHSQQNVSTDTTLTLNTAVTPNVLGVSKSVIGNIQSAGLTANGAVSKNTSQDKTDDSLRARIKQLEQGIPIVAGVTFRTNSPTWNITAQDNGNTIVFESKCVITFDAGLKPPFNVTLIQWGSGSAGQVQVTGSNVFSVGGYKRLRAQYGKVEAICIGPGSVIELSGDLKQ